MADKIEVYIKNEEVVTGRSYIGRPIADHWCTFKETVKMEKVLSEADRQTLEIVKEIAEKKNLSVMVYNVSHFTAKIRGKSKGVTKTPTIIIGDAKIEGVPDKEQILKLLQQ
jgi:hypothetical protein